MVIKNLLNLFFLENIESLFISPISIITTNLNNITFEAILKNDESKCLDIILKLYCDLNLCNEQHNYCKCVRVCIEQPVQFNYQNLTSQSYEPLKKILNINI